MKLSYVIIIAVFSTFFTSCGHHYYAPNELHLMGVSKKGEIKVGGGGSARKPWLSNTRFGTTSFQVAGSPFSHIAGGFNYYQISGKSTSGERPNGKGYIADFALGGYYSFPERETKFRGLLDMYVSHSWGEVVNNYSNLSQSTLHFKRPSLQFGSHVFFKDNISFGLGLRIAKLSYTDITYFHSEESEEIEQDLLYIQERNPFLMLELGMKIQYGFRHVKGFISVTTAQAQKAPGFPYHRDSFVFGFTMELDEFFKPKK